MRTAKLIAYTLIIKLYTKEIKMDKLISVIVPVYNVEAYIERCVESLINQSYKNIEIILVDDGSPDNCPAICDRLSTEDSRIKVLHKMNEGLGMARNSGMELARGEYIAFVDSDDYVEIDMLNTLIAAAERNGADIVYGGVWKTNNTTGEKIAISNTSFERVWPSREDTKELLLRFIGNDTREKRDTIMEVSVWKALFKTELIKNNNIRFVSEREMISEDLIFDIEILQYANCVVWIPECIYNYCVNPLSLSKSYREDRFQQIKKLYAKVKEQLESIYGGRDYMVHLDRMLISKARVAAKQSVQSESTIGKDSVKRDLEYICNDQDLIDALRRYKLWRLPLQYGIVAILMRHKCYIGLKIILR